jgi:hypothetical protein
LRLRQVLDQCLKALPLRTEPVIVVAWQELPFVPSASLVPISLLNSLLELPHIAAQGAGPHPHTLAICRKETLAGQLVGDQRAAKRRKRVAKASEAGLAVALGPEKIR